MSLAIAAMSSSAVRRTSANAARDSSRRRRPRPNARRTACRATTAEATAAAAAAVSSAVVALHAVLRGALDEVREHRLDALAAVRLERRRRLGGRRLLRLGVRDGAERVPHDDRVRAAPARRAREVDHDAVRRAGRARQDRDEDRVVRGLDAPPQVGELGGGERVLGVRVLVDGRALQRLRRALDVGALRRGAGRTGEEGDERDQGRDREPRHRSPRRCRP